MAGRGCATIDVSILALPERGSPKAAVDGYIGALLEWSALFDLDWLKPCLSEIAVASLIEQERYPLLEGIRELLNTAGIKEYDALTVARVASRLLDITPSLETRLGIRNALLDQASIEPEAAELGAVEGLGEELLRSLAIVAIAHRSRKGADAVSASMVVRAAPSNNARLRAQVHDVEHSLDTLPDIPKPPEFLEAEVPIFAGLKDLVAGFDETGLLIGAEDDAGIEMAVRVALFKQCLQDDPQTQWPTEAVARIGREFRQSCQRCCLDKGSAMPQKILRVIVETLRKSKMHTAHALRTDRRGSSPQRLRGADKAWRRDIDRKIHLHYWECPRGVIELASVTFHDDFTIPE